MGARIFSPDQVEWLACHYPFHSPTETTHLFNEAWGRSVTIDQIRRAAKNHALGPGPYDGRFRPGHVPANKGRRGLHAPGSEKGWFRPGHVGARTRPMYDERWTGEELQIKIPEASPYPSQTSRGWYQKSCWIAKSRWNWRKAGRTIPDGHVLLHLDGDPLNCELDNLECVPRAVLIFLNSHTVGVDAPDTPDGHRTRARIAQIRELIRRRTSNPTGKTPCQKNSRATPS